MNKVFLVGRLASDPVASTTSKGSQQSKITIAVNDNKQKDKAYFFPCVAWSYPANFINTYLKKGDLVAIDGQLTRHSFISKQSGQTIYSTEIVVDSINSIGSKRANNEFLKASEEQIQSIDSAFKNNIATNVEPSTQKIETPKFDNNEEIEWFDELEKGEK